MSQNSLRFLFIFIPQDKDTFPVCFLIFVQHVLVTTVLQVLSILLFLYFSKEMFISPRKNMQFLQVSFPKKIFISSIESIINSLQYCVTYIRLIKHLYLKVLFNLSFHLNKIFVDPCCC